MGALRWCYLGRVEYDVARRLQARLAEARCADRIGDVLLLLEHPPVLTIGRHAPVPPSPHGLPVLRTDRGGDVTYHGPGQIVGYPVCRLRARGRGVREFVSALEHALCDVALGLGIAAMLRRGYPGVWAGPRRSPRKLASIGLGVRRSVTLHGFALNVDERVERGFDGIAPCGLVGVRVTSLAALGEEAVPEMEVLAARIARAVSVRTDRRWVPRPLEARDLAVEPLPVRTARRSHGEGSADDSRAILIG